MNFEQLLQDNCFATDANTRQQAKQELEKYYCCEINCTQIDKSVRFAHHARGCTIIAAKISANCVIFQNDTIGSNMRYNKIDNKWENIGNPILAENVVVLDGAKILGPITIGKNTTIAAGAIITKDIPPNCVAFGVNQYKPQNPNYDLVYNPNMIDPNEIIEANLKRIAEFEATIE
jgi:serine O-acetyltransferase